MSRRTSKPRRTGLLLSTRVGQSHHGPVPKSARHMSRPNHWRLALIGESVAPGDANRARWFLLGAVLVTGVLYTIPLGWYIAYPLVLLSTYVHEISHGLAAALAGGQFDSLVIHADGSGLATISGNSGRFAFAFVAGAGLVGPAAGGAAFLMLASRPKLARVGLGVFALLSVVALIWIVRNIFWLVLRRRVDRRLRRGRVARDRTDRPGGGCVPRGAVGAQRVLASRLSLHGGGNHRQRQPSVGCREHGRGAVVAILVGSSHKCVHDSAPSRSATPWKEAADVFVPANQR